MKTIPYVKKITTATTEYRHTSKEDRQWVLDKCKIINDFIKAAKQINDDDIRDAVVDMIAPNKNIPRKGVRAGGGYNSVESMCEGILDNFSSGQYDFSNKTCKGIEESFKVASKRLVDIEEVEFVEVTSLPKPAPVEVVPQNTTYSDLFEITITVRKKQ